MRVTAVERVDGALLFQPVPHVDERGFFSRTFDAQVARSAGLDPAAFAQDSLSRSVRGVVRGMHVRRGDGESKLVRCSYGAVYDVIVDLRPGSPTYLNWASFELRDTEQTSLYIPSGAHMASRPSPTRRTFPTGSTGRTTRRRTCPSRSTTRSWPSRGRCPSP